MQSLTTRQRAIYEFIVQQVAADGIPPTLMEIADAFGLSSAAGVSDHLKAIERKGYIRRHRGASRGIQVRASEQKRSPRRLPVLGTVPGTNGLRAKSGAREHLTVDGSATTRDAFAVRVAQAGLERHGILPGDYLVIDDGSQPRRGDLGLAVTRSGRTLLVEAESARTFTAVEAPRTASGNAHLLGRVVAVFRRLP